MKIKHLLILLASLILFTSFVISQTTRQNVILVIIDGARYSETLGDTTARFIPKMKKLSLQGTVIDTFVNDGITVTKRAVPAIWSGSWATPKDTLNTQYTVVPSVWEYFRKAKNVDATQAIYILASVSSPWLQSYHPEYGPPFWPLYITEGNSDLYVWQNTKSKLLAYHPQLCVMYLSNVDHEGHSGIWNNYTNAITIADSIVGMLWDFIKSDSIYIDKTTLLVTNDHGRHLDGVSTGFAGHGDGCWGCRHIMFFGIGSAVKKTYISNVRRIIPDIVPTIGTILNFPTPYVTGESMDEILTSISIVKNRHLAPKSFELFQNYPNPFNPTTAISYHLPALSKMSGKPDRQAGLKAISSIMLKVYDMFGREVATLAEGDCESGLHTVTFNASHLPAGVYFYRLIIGSENLTRKLILLR